MPLKTMAASNYLFIRSLLCLAVLTGGGLIASVDATMCSATTGNYCPTTLFSTGTCDADLNCTCVTGYFPATWGCRKELDVPVIELLENDAIPYGSEGSNFTLVCSPSDKGSTNYIWRAEGIIVPGEIESTLFVQEPNMTGSPYGYTCQYSETDQVSSQSANFEINIILLSDLSGTEPEITPELLGVPTTLLNETTLTLVCTNIMKLDREVFFGVFLDSLMQTDNVLTGVVSANVSSDAMCWITYDSGSTTLSFFGPFVTFPLLSDNIPGVHIAEGDRYAPSGVVLTLTCAFDEDDFVSDGLSITWGWSFNGTTDGGLTTQAISFMSLNSATDHGEWRCTAQYNAQPVRESPAIFVNVDFPMTVSVSTVPAVPVTDGFMEIVCGVDSSLMAVDFTYSWSGPMITLSNYLDNTLFVNEVSMTDVGTFGCTAEIDLMSATNSIMIATPSLFSSATAPSLSINNTGGVLDFTEAYALTCTIDPDYATPGIEYTFSESGEVVASGFDNTYVVTGNVTDRSFTCEAVFNSLSPGESNAVDVAFAVIDTVEIVDLDANVITAINGVVNVIITLLCEYILLPDVVGDPVITWFDLDMNEVGVDMILDLNVTQEGNVTYYCVVELGSSSQLSSNNVTVTGHVLGTPVLSLLNGDPATSLDFSLSYFLRCAVDPVFMGFELEYEFLQDGSVFEADFNDTFLIPNDVEDRTYTCIVVFETTASSSSNSIQLTYEVFDSVEILDTDQNVITDINGIVDTVVSLVCAVNLVPEVIDEPSVTWFTQDMVEVGADMILDFTVTNDPEVTFFCVADIGSHSMRTANNVTLHSHSFTTPVLTIVGGMATEGLDFQQGYQLHCEAGDSITSLFDIRYTFTKDGIDDVFNTSSDTYTVQNDVLDRRYECEALLQTVVSPISNSLNFSFSVFQSVDILSTNGSILTTVNTFENTSFTLVSSVSLLPGVPGSATINWFDDALDIQGTGFSLVVNTTVGLNASYFFVATLGSHTVTSPDVLITAHPLDAPVLNFTDSIDGNDLDFSQSYYLLCDLGINFTQISLQYDFHRDGMVVQTSTNNSYAIYNDVMDREYTCQVSYHTLISPKSNSINVTFGVFDAIDIVESMRCHVRSDIDPTFVSTLMCNVSLMPGVPDEITYLWDDGSNNNVSTLSTYSFFVMEDVNKSVVCHAELGSHVETFSVEYEVFTSNITVPCSASCFHLSLTLLGFTIVSAYYCLFIE